MKDREPVLGPNAKPFFIQLVVGVAVVLALTYLGVGQWVYDTTHSFVGPVLQQSGVCGYVTC